MRICVVGCGAVGSLFAAHLAQLDDLEVWAYDLAQEHVDAINRNGLRLSGAGDLVGRPRATSDATELPRCDFGIVATKAMHTSSAIAATAGAFGDGCVATVQNGLGNEEAIAEHAERVIRGTTFPAGKLLEPGHVQWDVKGDTTFGPFEPRPAPAVEVERLADACTRAGLPTRAVADARGTQWRKVIFNAATNPIGALDRAHARARMRRPGPATARQRARRRGEGGRGRAGRSSSMRTPRSSSTMRRSPRLPTTHKASMLQDVEARRTTEIDYLNGGIVRFGEEQGVADAAKCRDLGACERRGAIVVSKGEIERRHAAVRAAMDEHRVDAVLVCGSEYTGFEGAVTYMSGFVIVHRYAYVLLPREGDPSIIFPGEARYVGVHGNDVDRRPGLRGSAGRMACRPPCGQARGRLRARLRPDRARLRRVSGQGRRRPVRRRVRPCARGEKRRGARVGARLGPHQHTGIPSVRGGVRARASRLRRCSRRPSATSSRRAAAA